MARPPRWLLPFVLALGGATAFAAEAPPARPNVVLIITDDQRWDMIGSAGNKAIKTPAIDRLAREGVYFRQATAHAPQCTPSRATMLTGVSPHTHGLSSNRMRGASAAAIATLPMLPQALRAAGYRTVFIGKWHVDFLPTHAGFADVRTWMKEGIGPYRDAPSLLRGMDGDRPSGGGYTNDLFADDAAAFLESDAATAQPFFLWLALTAPHAPHQPNPPDLVRLYAGKTERELWPPALPADAAPQELPAYCEAVSAADRALGRVLDALDRRGLAAGTLVVFVSDNGLMLGERGADAAASGPAGGKSLPYEAAVRVPLLARGPGVAQGLASDRTVSTIDLPPTILAVAGVPPEKRWQGRDLRAALRDATQGPEDAFLEFADSGKGNAAAIEYRAVRTASSKLIVWPPPRPPELYDLAADPSERHNVVADPASATKRKDLYARLRGWLAATDDPARAWSTLSGIVPTPAR